MLKLNGKKLSALVAVLAVTAVAVVPEANAALPTAAATAFTTLETYIADIEAVLWDVVPAVTLAFVLIKLFKRGANKV